SSPMCGVPGPIGARRNASRTRDGRRSSRSGSCAPIRTSICTRAAGNGEVRTADALPGRRPLLLLALGVLAFYGFATTRSTLWDRDEPRFAQATVEMIASGDHLVPTFNHELRPDKPILIYWLQSVPMRLFGAHEWTARFWAPVGVAIAALLTAAIGRRLFGARVGFLAAAMLVSTMLVFVEGTAA